ncbi:hypothetical protein CK203_109764 [Vitis vinifera]|uniref:Uncharacterized protein n=1 Tax=Vitis vinifera TaxID=29760 RepID=A0A438DLL9_VITVI|nr:hypothetical protein CK203_109764 [Vitis vinifera]
MEASPAAINSQSLSPQFHVVSSFPPELRIEEALENDGASGSGSQLVRLSFMRRFKRTAKRIVKHPPTCKSPFVV